jgi:ATP-dependent RNA helicase DeaD
MLADPLLSEPAGDEELVQGRALLESRPAEAIAAALIRLYRARLPAPEEVFDGRGTSAPAPRETAGGEPHSNADDMVWFRMAIGRRNNADPKWLLPLICRVGHVTKKDIGRIRIFDRETKFEILQDSATRFAAAAAASGETEMAIGPADPAQAGRHAPGGPHRPGSRKPAGRRNPQHTASRIRQP